MGGWKSGGANVYLGVTRSGKTTLAKKHLEADAARWKNPVVTLDLESAMDWVDVPHAASADEVLEALYVRRQAPRVWTPRDLAERTKFFKAVSHWGGACVLVDGLPMIADGHNFEEDFRQALYRWGHGRLGPTFYYLVAQRASLVHRNVFAAARVVYVFRQAPGADAARMYAEFGIPPGTSTTLGRGAHVPIELGFPEEADGQT
jgi:hypothetical protein